MGPIVAVAAVIAAAYPRVYLPLLTIISIMSFPTPAASATADPLMPEKIKLATTLTCPMPPRNRPTRAMQNLSNRSDIAPAFIILAETINNGTASKRKPSNKRCTIISPAIAKS